jgi:hypothetical protein
MNGDVKIRKNNDVVDHHHMIARIVRVLGMLGRVVFVVATGCSSAHVEPLDMSKPLNTLTPPEVKQLCDLSAKLLGGYGGAVSCDGGPNAPLHAAMSQDDCVTGLAPHLSMPTCVITVGELIGCLDWTAANWCTDPAPPVLPTCSEFQAGCY